MEARSNSGARQKTGSDHVAPDCRGMNFYRADDAFRGLLDLYMEPALRAHLEPHLDRLGGLAGGRLDELADAADKHPPVLHPRDRFGRDEDWIEYHPAYREMERIAFSELGLHAMSHRAGVLGWPAPMPPIAKYGFQYLFVQAEFGLMCPVSVSDTSNFIIFRYGSDELKRKLVPRLLSQDPAELWKGTQFMTEKSGGSDVGALETEARHENGEWRLYGEKWFCSHTDADLALILARPQGAATGTRGLGLFAMPRRLEDGSRNRYRIVRLKDKLGTRSMASGEIRLEGAFAWQVGELRAGFKQMLDQVNLSRLSHGVRAAAMMRRCLNEALCVAHNRIAFGRALIEMPLVRRQLLKLMVPAEQALSMYAWTADVMHRANRADEGAVHLLRILTPLFKFRACRDNLRVATGAMEVRGGNGYIEDWINPRLVRDAQIGVLWEGTSNINALDAIGRAAAKMGAHEALGAALHARLAEASRVPQRFRSRLGEAIDRAVAFAARSSGAAGERLARMAAGALYNAATAVLMAWEAARLNNGRRLLLSRMVVEHRLSAQDPLAPPDGAWEEQAAAMLLGEGAVTLEQAAAVINS
ncbi:MAG TPA: acyl-CoA dehydrogenase family protein [Candidatus Binataceae bacterium]|jgi:alkylation response protein AidB-like acyl-CoA dehydrogenase|nr:acyl-CoA dehydrogenase family protein [Candidatus Binataceae bacterium]